MTRGRSNDHGFLGMGTVLAAAGAAGAFAAASGLRR